MPRLLGIVEYYFVQPFVDAEGKAAWKHPDGYKFEIIRDLLMEDAIAEATENWLRKCQSQVRLCAELGHGVGDCVCEKYDPVNPQWRCERWLRLASGNTRTKERTMLVRVQVPL